MVMILKTNEDKFEYRLGDSGPKYLMKGPRINFAIVRLKSGQDYRAHKHNIMEESFYVINGKIDIVVEDEKYTLIEGDFLNIPPGQEHYLFNSYSEPVKMVAVLAPYIKYDKIEVENPSLYG